MNPGRSSAKLPCGIDDIDDFLAIPNAGAKEALRGVKGDIIVLGAGGKMGFHLCLLLKRALAALGRSNNVFAASRFRSINSHTAYESKGIKTFSGDFRDPEFLASLPLCPTVFYLVGAKFGTSTNPDLLREINVEVAARIANRYRASRIVAFSTGCVYSYVTPQSGGSKEDSETNPIGAYAQSCLEREHCFESVSREQGTPVVLIRLNYSVEFRYGVLLDIGQNVFNGKPVDVTVGHVNVIWQNDALNQIVQSMVLADSPAVAINITGPEVVSVRDIGKRFAKQLQRPALFEGEEADTMWLSNAARSHELFGRPSVDWETMVDWLAAWLQQGGPTHGKPTGFERRDGQF